MVKFEATKDEFKLAGKIAKRAVVQGLSRSYMDTEMDIIATHSTSPLRLKDLLKADDFNFAHDVLGITRNLNRSTGLLENCFSPRYSK